MVVQSPEVNGLYAFSPVHWIQDMRVGEHKTLVSTALGGALRLYTYNLGPNVWVPAAGVPWFVTLFGRDSLVVSLQNMLTDPGFAPGALQLLAQFQATERDDWRDAQPGKILHGMRVGELTHFHQIPFSPYYGTWDATTLYLTGEMNRIRDDVTQAE